MASVHGVELGHTQGFVLRQLEDPKLCNQMRDSSGSHEMHHMWIACVLNVGYMWRICGVHVDDMRSTCGKQVLDDIYVLRLIDHNVLQSRDGWTYILETHVETPLGNMRDCMRIEYMCSKCGLWTTD